jgi:putative DNA methylase
MKLRKKLIEVALPLEAINVASAREKSIRHGHPSTLHLWWARRPLAAARAVIFAQMVDDPSAVQEEFPTDEDQAKERERLFMIMEELVKWESTTNEAVLQAARDEILRSWWRTCADNTGHPLAAELFDPNKLPAFHDPFAGGGALPLEAQRLGLKSYASDLNPVAVLINKAMIEFPPRFAGQPPVNPDARSTKDLIDREWRGAHGLAEDVRYYGHWLRTEAHRRIGHLYPRVEVTPEMAEERPDLNNYVGKKLTVIAWLWARTVNSPNPAFANVRVPLVSSFVLSPMASKEARVVPIVEGDTYRFTVQVGNLEHDISAAEGTKLGGKGGFRCLLSGTPISFDYIRTEASMARMTHRLMAVVAEGENTRVYLSPRPEFEETAKLETPEWIPDTETSGKCRVNIGLYGMTTWDKLFTDRQLVALTTFSDLVQLTRDRIKHDAVSRGLADDGLSLDAGGAGADAYADAIATYLAFLVSKLADKGSTICTWDSGPSTNRTSSGRSARVATVRVTFGRQALPMTWDFAEVNFFSDSVGSIDTVLDTLTVPLEYFPFVSLPGFAMQLDASSLSDQLPLSVISTDPPYFDNISYADLSDFFYVWLRRTLKSSFVNLLSTVAVPKAEELIASPSRHGSKEAAEVFFLEGMTQVMHRLAAHSHPSFPVTIYYAFKQSETQKESGRTSSTGWETFLDAVIRAGFNLSGTWPMRTEMASRMIGSGSNALASSIILVCRKRPNDAPTATRREFVSALEAELAPALRKLQAGNIAPVDLAQAAIGPGMAVYTRYAKVLNAEGKPLSVKQALELINEKLDMVLAEQEGDFDADTRWALAWFEQMGFTEGDYGVAETLSKAKNTSVAGMHAAGILESKAGKVRLLRPNELPTDWDPRTEPRLSAWQSVHQLVRVLEAGGEDVTAELVAKLGGAAEIARELPYRLYTICERKKRAQEALQYNALVQSWPEITRLARQTPSTHPQQAEIFGR